MHQQFYNSFETHNYLIQLDSANSSIYDSNKASATWILQNPLQFPGEPSIGLYKIYYRNYFINISTGVNDQFVIVDSNTATTYTLTIPEGSYKLSDLNAAIVQGQQQEGIDVIELIPNYAANKVALEFKDLSGWYVDFVAGTCYSLLGWNLADIVPPLPYNLPFDYILAPNDAQFDSVTSVRVRTNLIDSSLVDTNTAPIIYSSNPGVDNSEYQIESPFNIIFMPSKALQSPQTTISIQLLDQLNQPLNITDNFGVGLIVKY